MRYEPVFIRRILPFQPSAHGNLRLKVRTAIHNPHTRKFGVKCERAREQRALLSTVIVVSPWLLIQPSIHSFAIAVSYTCHRSASGSRPGRAKKPSLIWLGINHRIAGYGATGRRRKMRYGRLLPIEHPRHEAANLGDIYAV